MQSKVSNANFNTLQLTGPGESEGHISGKSSAQSVMSETFSRKVLALNYGLIYTSCFTRVESIAIKIDESATKAHE